MEPPPNSTFFPPPTSSSPRPSSPRPSSPISPAVASHTLQQPPPSLHPHLSAQTSSPTRLPPTFQEAAAQRQRGGENPYTIDPSASWPLGPEARQVQGPEATQMQMPLEYLVPIPSSPRHNSTPNRPQHTHQQPDHTHQQPDHAHHKRATYSHPPKPLPRRLDRANTSPLSPKEPEGGERWRELGGDGLPEGVYVELGPDNSSQPIKPTKPKPAPRRKLPQPPSLLSPTKEDNVSDAFYLPMQPCDNEEEEPTEKRDLPDHFYEIPDEKLTPSQQNGSRELSNVVDKMTQAFSPAQLDLFVQMLQQVTVGGQTVSMATQKSPSSGAASESSLQGNLRKGPRVAGMSAAMLLTRA